MGKEGLVVSCGRWRGHGFLAVDCLCRYLSFFLLLYSRPLVYSVDPGSWFLVDVGILWYSGIGLFGFHQIRTTMCAVRDDDLDLPLRRLDGFSGGRGVLAAME